MVNCILLVRPASCACTRSESHRPESFPCQGTSSHEHVSLSHLYLAYKEPDIHIENTALDAWKNCQLANAEALLTAAISTSKDNAHVLASRAPVWGHLQQWDAALIDAEEVRVALLSHV